MSKKLAVEISDNQLMAQLVGERDELISVVEASFDVDLLARGNKISIEGTDAAKASAVIYEMLSLLQSGEVLTKTTVYRCITMLDENASPTDVLTDRVITTHRGKTVKPRTAGQKRYIDTIRANLVTFGIGPAGTGKSWLAVACALAALQRKEVDRILLTRPAVEAGESLGYLPGDLMSKVDPYLRPLYDALHDMIGPEQTGEYFDRGIVEVAPLAFMRGRTLNDSFVILDEAQNASSNQMMMFLTRLGFNSRAVVTGDQTQVDVADRKSGLVGLEKVLGGVADLEFVNLTSADVVRHKIVQDIVDAYAKAPKR